jgi:predicted RNase H-like HicB family nuclease
MIRIPYTSQLYEEVDQYVAVCPELNVSSFGDTPDKALSALQEVVALFLEECQ